MIDPNSDLTRRMPKGWRPLLAWLVFLAALLCLLVSGFCAVVFPIMGLQTNSQMERDIMMIGGLVVGLPCAVLSGLLAWWMKRIIKRWKAP